MKKLLITLSVASIMAGCASSPEKVASSEQKAIHKTVVAPNSDNNDMYVAYADGRENIFYDADEYKSFLKVGESTFRKTYIGAGTNGMTRSFGLTKADKKKPTNPAEQMLKGELAPASDFYAEVYNEERNRFYVFGNWQDFSDYLKTGIDTYHYTEIGAGPKGATVVYVLNKSNNKVKPEATVKQFKANHAD
ncbi:hypothetical protein CYQ88_07900 [Hydrogenovibrio sp. SC-1]|uniref:hypothetical protein n=1 Tax=Hydrogenovibrio sp. SC-1 TaxID=2065820 RepID=UPI000C79E2F3|nr:hypothetical protein [Hydrogenovibrio sp. SC-1]PLA74017.1 hypothetical protein CYQ88_07900 [Hydrogenovibrio sp. SC-1]